MSLNKAMQEAFVYLENNFKCTWTTGFGNKEALIKAFSQKDIPKHSFLGYKGSDGIRHSFNRAIKNHNKPKGMLWEHWLLQNIDKFYCSQCKSVHSISNKVVKKYLCKQCDIYNVQSRKEIKQLLIYKYLITSKGCVDCGEKDPICLDFDHRNPEEKSFSISEGYFKSEQELIEEVEKCDIVCANCHRKRTSKQFNQFRYKQGILA